MWIHRDKCEDSWSKAARNRQTFWPLLPQNHPSYLPPPLHPPHILHCQGDSARPCVPSPPVSVGPWRAAGAASESAASLLWKDDVSHVGKSAIEILLFLIIASSVCTSREYIPGLVTTGSSAPSLTVTVTDSVCSSSWPDGVLSLRMMLTCNVRSPWGRVGALTWRRKRFFRASRPSINKKVNKRSKCSGRWVYSDSQHILSVNPFF